MGDKRKDRDEDTDGDEGTVSNKERDGDSEEGK